MNSSIRKWHKTTNGDCILKFSCLLNIIWLIFGKVSAISKDTTNDFEANHVNITTFHKRQAIFGPTCVPLTAINGQVNYLQTNPSMPYSQGTTAILSCNAGFVISGAPNSVCMNSMWSPSLGSCMPNGMNILPSFGIGSIGMENFGNVQAPRNDLSQLVSGAYCFPLIPSMNSRIQYSSGSAFGLYNSGSTASLICNPGFIAAGSSFSTCETGSWHPSLGFCVNTASGRNFNGIGNINAGYSLNGVTIAGGTGMNSPSPLMMGASTLTAAAPSSSASLMPQCNALPGPSNGHISYSLSQINGGYPIGTMANLICQPGFMPSQMTSLCGASGTWNPPIGSCNAFHDSIGKFPPISLMNMPSNANCLIGILPPLGAKISYSQGDPFGPYPPGTIATMFCYNGTPIGASKSKCEFGQWSPPLLQGCSMSDFSMKRVLQDNSKDESSSLASNLNRFDGNRTGANGSYVMDQPQGPQGMNGMPFQGAFGGSAQMGAQNRVGMPGQICTLGVPPVVGGTIMYSKGGDLGPYPTGTIATLQCHNGLPLGLISSSCFNGIWSPPAVGPCSNPNQEEDTNQKATGPPTPAIGPGLPTPPTSPISDMFNKMGSQGPNGGGMPMSSFGMGEFPNNGGPSNPSIGVQQNGMQIAQNCLIGPLSPLNGQIVYTAPGNAPSGNPNFPGLLSALSNTPSLSPPYPPGTVATLRCYQGFVPNGSSSAICRNGLFDPSLLGQCMPMNMGSGGVPPGTNNGGVMPMGSVQHVSNDEERKTDAERNENDIKDSKSSSKNIMDDEESEEQEDFEGCPDFELNDLQFGHVVYYSITNEDNDREQEPTSNISRSYDDIGPTIRSVTRSTGRTTPLMIQHQVGTFARLICDDGHVFGGTTARCESTGWSTSHLGDCISTTTTENHPTLSNDENEQSMQHSATRDNANSREFPSTNDN